MRSLAPVWALVLLLTACSQPPHPSALGGILDLRSWDWDQGPMDLAGEWEFEGRLRKVPDTWTGSEAGAPNGQGAGTYRLRVLLPEGSPSLKLRWTTASTAFTIRTSGTELARVGTPDADPKRAVPAYAPGAVRIPEGTVLDLEIFVSNHEYRVGGLWRALSLGPASVIEAGRWESESSALALASALGVIGLSSLLLFSLRRKEKTFLHLGVFALVVAMRSLVTAEYPLVRIFPGLPFDFLIRLEYLTAFLPIPTAALFFGTFFPGLAPRWLQRVSVWPSLAFVALTLILGLNLLTRSILLYYTIALPTLLVVTVLVARRILIDRQGYSLLIGVGILALAGGADLLSSALYSRTGTFLPWGLGTMVVLQATTLARRFLGTLESTQILLAEKELLVMEIHHRVKNSLQVVASLVSLQSNRTEDQGQKAVFQALRHRITAIALVHEKLYGQGLAGRPDVGEYLTDLLKLQYPGDGLGTGGVVWEIHADPLSAGVDYCIDAGLILTELVSNAHKHAILPRGGGRLHVSIRIHEGRLGIEVSDNGPGFPPDFSPESSKGLGFRLIQALLKRNDGTLSIIPGEGGRVNVDLKLPTAAD